MGNKNNYNANNFMQVGYQNNGGWNDGSNYGGKNCDKGCNDDVMAISNDKGCGCGNNYDNDVMVTSNNNDCCDHGSTYNNNGCGCDNDTGYANDNGKWGKNRGRGGSKHVDCDCNNADETHIFFESCDGSKEVSITGRCQEDEAMGRTLDVNCTLLNVCPGRRSALGMTLTEVDDNGDEYARGFRAITVPAHNARCNQDVNVDTVRFILPEDLSLQNRRHFIVRTQHHYLDASNIWNNGWGGKH